jgi:hypothetical protein
VYTDAEALFIQVELKPAGRRGDAVGRHSDIEQVKIKARHRYVQAHYPVYSN